MNTQLTSKQWLKPYLLGREAFEQKLTVNDCPYQDKLNDAGHPTFSRAWRTRWMLGFLDAREGLPIRFISKSSDTETK